MTKDVIVTISGLQFAQETETEPVEIVTAGSYYKKNGKHYIIYDEVMEGFEGSTKNIIKLTEDSLDVTKKGVTNVHMVFEENKKNKEQSKMDTLQEELKKAIKEERYEDAAKIRDEIKKLEK